MKKELKQEGINLKNNSKMRIVKNSKGITLIALVITIIVLLILAGVSIAMLTGENGILTRASDAKEQTEIAEVKERAQTDILGEQAGNKGKLTKSKFIEILNKYFKDVPTEENFSEDLTSLTLETKEEYGSHDIKISEIYNGSFPKTIDSLKVGEKVYYDTGNTSVGNQGIIECTVLYDKSYNETNGTNYGVQIISTDVIKDAEGTAVTVTLGFGDTTVIGSDDFEKAKNSYNNALKTLYDEAQDYLNAAYASEARCVGSIPNNPSADTNEMYVSSSDYPYLKKYDNMFKIEDTNRQEDIEQMEKLDIYNAGNKYWLASRIIDPWSNSYGGRFGIAYGAIRGSAVGYLGTLFQAGGRYETKATTLSYGLRPVVTLNSEIKVENGDGDATPYTLTPYIRTELRK